MRKRSFSLVLATLLVGSVLVLPAQASNESAPTEATETEQTIWEEKQGTLAAGEFHSVWIDGSIHAIGKRDSYKGSEKWKDVTKVAAWDVTVGIKSDGSVVLAGTEKYRYNHGSISGWSDIVDVDVNECNIAGLTSSGTVVVVGSNSENQCDVSYWTDIVDVAVGERNVYGLTSNGTVVSSGYPYTVHANVSSSKWRDIVAITAGTHFVAGLKKDGTVVASGCIDDDDVSQWTDIVAIDAGADHLVGLREDGTVIAASYDNSKGQCNVGGWTDIVAVAAGRFHTAAMKSDGTVVVTGDNGHGQCNV